MRSDPHLRMDSQGDARSCEGLRGDARGPEVMREPASVAWG